ncbi:hypothetical protein EAF00_011388 [Botryotinia globosa]|nr:hypothetical protein EAF00_011388 [Botryotinia globosa]
MSFSYKHVLLIGATSGIGLAMAERLVQECKVTVVGRRKDRLDEFVGKHGDKAKSISFDIELSRYRLRLPQAGYQRKHDSSKPESVDIKGFIYETHVNFTSFHNYKPEHGASHKSIRLLFFQGSSHSFFA